MIAFDLDVNPSWGRKDDKFTIARGQRRITLSSKYRKFVDAVALQIRQWMVHRGHRGITATEGLGIAVSIRWAAGRQRGDVDATLSAVLDAVQASGLVANDRAFDRVEAYVSTSRPGDHGIMVQIWTIETGLTLPR